MPILGNDMDRVLAELQRMNSAVSEDDVGVLPTFIWDGAEYNCTRGPNTKGNLWGAGGFTGDNNLTIYVRVLDLPPTLPQPDQFITFEGEEYRIDTVSKSSDGAMLTIVCNDPDRAAGTVKRAMRDM